MNIRHDSIVKLVPLNVHRQKKNIIVEDILAKEFYEMTPAAADAIEAIQAGTLLNEIEDELKQRYPDEEIDLLQFVADLVEIDLVLEIDNHVLQQIDSEELEAETAPNEQPFVNKLGRWLYRSPLILIYVAGVLCSIWLLITQPDLRPTIRSMAQTDILTLNVLIWAGLSLFLLALHEFNHFLAARSYQIPAKFGYGHRFYFLVVETQLAEIWRLPPRQRLIPYLAGMMNDSVMLALTMILRLAYPDMHERLYAILGLATFYLCIGIVFQAMVFAKTDLYYVVETISGHLNLQERTSNWLKRMFRRSKSEEQEPLFIKIFGFIHLAGYAFIAWFFFKVFYPQLTYFLSRMMIYLQLPINDIYFWDGILFVVLNGMTLVLLVLSWYRQLRGYLIAKFRT